MVARVFLLPCFVAVAIGCKGSPGSVQLDVPENKTLIRGQEEEIVVRLRRQNFDSPVTVKMADLPGGVTVKDSAQNEIAYAGDDNEATFTVTAGATAELGEHPVAVTASGDNMAPVTETFILTVTE